VFNKALCHDALWRSVGAIHGTLPSALDLTDQLHDWTDAPPEKEFSVTSEQMVGSCAQTQSKCCGEEEETPVPVRNESPIACLSTPQLSHSTTSAMLDLTVI
jgi:hypothetical protein